MTTLYRCTACGARTPSPGRLEGNWCPDCRARGTLEFLPEDPEAARLATRLASAAKRSPSHEEVAGLVEEAMRTAGGEAHHGLAALRDPALFAAAMFLEEERGCTAMDLYRTGRFRTKTEAFLALGRLAEAGLAAWEKDFCHLTGPGEEAARRIRAARSSPSGRGGADPPG